MTWTTRPRVNWSKVELLEKKIPTRITPYSNWTWLKAQLDLASPPARSEAIAKYIKLYGEHKPVIDEIMNLIYSDVPSNWFDITLEKVGS